MEAMIPKSACTRCQAEALSAVGRKYAFGCEVIPTENKSLAACGRWTPGARVYLGMESVIYETYGSEYTAVSSSTYTAGFTIDAVIRRREAVAVLPTKFQRGSGD